jgi:monovalent cation:H+ antiporter-2, CPA2 family
LGAFLAGMIVGQSDFSARATADALPMRDAFAVLFFVSVGMLFDPSGLAEGWPLMLATIGIVIIGKPLAAMVVVLLFRRPLREALSISVALAQIGEFSFIVAALGISLQVLPVDATNAIVVAAVVSITLNPLLYKAIRPFVSWLESRGHISPRLITPDGESPASEEGAERVIMIGHGPVGSTLTRLLRDNQVDVVVVEMNLETITALKASGIPAVYGDATQRQTLHHVGIENAKGLVITASDIPARDIVQAAREINPHLQILSRAPTLRDVEPLKQAGADAVFSGEGEVALAMSSHLLRSMGASDAKIEGERVRFHEEFLQAPSA